MARIGSQPEEDRKQTSRSGWFILAFVVMVIILLIFFLGWLTR